MPTVPPGARMTPLSGLAQRITQAARYVVSGVQPDTWFGPFQPLAPMAPDQEGVKGRRYDYPTGINLNYIPRSDAPISFVQLRALADSCDLLRIVIESRKDQIASLDWVIRPRVAPTGVDPGVWHKQGAGAHPELSDDLKNRITAITQFLRYPDRKHTWDVWVREWMEDVFVIDAPAIWRRRTRGGKLYALELIAGDTIKPLLGPDGREPDHPDPAYQEILHGIPAANYSAEEMIYCPWNPRTNRLYGYSKVEQILITINTSIRRSMFQLDWYTEGSQPDAFMGLPKDWNLTQIKDFQDYMDSLLAGNLAVRRRLRFVPGEFKYQETKSPPLKDVFDEYLARVICFTFAVAPDPFIEHVSRGAVEKSHTRALEEGLEPNQRYIKSVVDRIIMEDFESPDLEFKYVEDREQDPKDQMTIDAGYAKSGIMSIDEIRLARGLPPLGGPASIPMLATPSGYIPLNAMTAPNIQEHLANAGAPAAQAKESQSQPKRGGASSGGHSGANDDEKDDHNDSLQHGKEDDEETAGEQSASHKFLEYLDGLPDLEKVDGASRSDVSSGGEGTWWPEAVTPPDLNRATAAGSGSRRVSSSSSRPYPGASSWDRPLDNPRAFPRPKGGSGGARRQGSQARDQAGGVGIGLHPQMFQQPPNDYYHDISKVLVKFLSFGKDLTDEMLNPDSEDSVDVPLPIATDSDRGHIASLAWEKLQAGDFRLVPREVSLRDIVATKEYVSESVLSDYVQEYDRNGDQSIDPPLLVESDGLYYVLSGHYPVLASKMVGYNTVICDLLEGNVR